MEKTFEELTAEALELSVDDRLALGERLLESVPIDTAVQEAWDAEIARRVAGIRTGKVKGVSADVVEAELREIIS